MTTKCDAEWLNFMKSKSQSSSDKITLRWCEQRQISARIDSLAQHLISRPKSASSTTSNWGLQLMESPMQRERREEKQSKRATNHLNSAWRIRNAKRGKRACCKWNAAQRFSPSQNVTWKNMKIKPKWNPAKHVWDSLLVWPPAYAPPLITVNGSFLSFSDFTSATADSFSAWSYPECCFHIR